MNRRRWLRAQVRTALAGALAGVTLPVAAQQAPPVRIVVGFAAGGSVDALGRIVAEHLQAAWGALSSSTIGPGPPAGLRSSRSRRHLATAIRCWSRRRGR